MNKEALHYCIKLLSRRDYSQYKLQQKLIQRNYSMEDIAEVIDILVEKKYLNEQNYARIRIRTWAEKSISKELIAQKLEQEKLFGYQELIEEIFREYHYQENDQLTELIHKKLRHKDIPDNPSEVYQLKNKVLRYLLSKGHQYQSAVGQLEQYLAQRIQN